MEMHIELWMSMIEEKQLLISIITLDAKYWAFIREMLYNSQFIESYEHPVCIVKIQHDFARNQIEWKLYFAANF